MPLKLRAILKQLEKPTDGAALTPVKIFGTALAMHRQDKTSCPGLRQASVSMRVERTRQAERRAVKRRRTVLPQVIDDAAGRALVVLTPAETPETVPASYREAEFLAHLIATKEHLPQTCERRRADPAEAIAAYGAADALTKHD